MVLQTDEALVLGTATVIEEVEGGGPSLLAELAILQDSSPFGRPQVIAEHLDAVLGMLHMTVLDTYANLIPLPSGLGVLGLGRYHIIERAGLTVVVLPEFGIGMTFVIEHLTFRC